MESLMLVCVLKEKLDDRMYFKRLREGSYVSFRGVGSRIQGIKLASQITATAARAYAAADSSVIFLISFFSALLVKHILLHGRNKFISFSEESTHFGFSALSIFKPSNLISRVGIRVVIMRLLLTGSVPQTRAGQKPENQRLLCEHLCRNMSPPQHPSSSCFTRRVDHVPGRGDVDSVFTSLMLGAQTQSQLTDSVSLMSNH